MKPILLATDGSPSAEAATKTAIAFAKALETPLLIVSIWDIAYEPIGVGRSTVVPDLDHAAGDEASRIVEGAADSARQAGLEVETITRRGLPVEEICAIAEEHDPALVVVGSHGWGPLRRMFFGSVSTGVLHHARRPLLVVPSGVTEQELERDDNRVKAEV
jgi:nucleotide-binding universal stress UspA family protein